MTKKIAVLLTVFNRKQQTLSCLDKLFQQKIPNGYILKVFLTDDGSTDGTTDAIIKQFPEKVNIIQGNGNLYWNRGMWTAWNHAAKDGHFDYYLWLNDDTDLHNGAITTLLKTSDANNNKAIIIGATVDTITHKHLTYGGRTRTGSVAPCDGRNVEVDYFNGNIVLIPNAVYQVLGNLDYYFTHSKGDFDYGMRAKKYGIRMVQCGMVLGECNTHQTLDNWCNPNVPFLRRWQMLKRPNGMPPNETFHLNRKHKGLRSAIQAYITIYLRCFFPNLWVIAGRVDKSKLKY